MTMGRTTPQAVAAMVAPRVRQVDSSLRCLGSEVMAEAMEP